MPSTVFQRFTIQSRDSEISKVPMATVWNGYKPSAFIKKYIYLLFGCTGFWLQPAESLVVARGIYFPGQGVNQGPLHWEQGPTGPTVKFQQALALNSWILQPLSKQLHWLQWDRNPDCKKVKGTEKSRHENSKCIEAWGVLRARTKGLPGSSRGPRSVLAPHRGLQFQVWIHLSRAWGLHCFW